VKTEERGRIKIEGMEMHIRRGGEITVEPGVPRLCDDSKQP
jgi:hypothetical protein